MVKNNIRNIVLIKKRAQFEALNQGYAGIALEYLRSVQPPSINRKGLFWFNRTGQAALRLFTGTIREQDTMGWFAAHGVNYGPYLELANDKQNAALYPTIKRFAGRYLKDVKRIYGG